MSWGGPRVPGPGKRLGRPPSSPQRPRKNPFPPKAAAAPKTMPSLDAVAAIIEASNATARRGSRGPTVSPFRVAQHPPKSTPPKSLQMAMDESLSWAETQWAAGMLGSVAGEGLLFLGYPYLAELAQRPEYRVISETIATEMTRKWIKFGSTGGKAKKKAERALGEDRDLQGESDLRRAAEEREPTDKEDNEKTGKIKELVDFLDDLHVKDRFADVAIQDGFFGRSHVAIDFGDGRDDELKTPIADPYGKLLRGKVRRGSLKRLQPVEAVWTYPTTYNATNPLQSDWYNPQVWYVMGREIHRSRLPTFIGRPVPDLLKPAYSFGGLSLSQMAKPYVDIWLTTRESVGALIHSFSVMVLLTDLQTILAPGNATGLLARAALFNALRDNQGLMVVNKATEDFKNVQAALGGLHELQAQSQEHMMSVARIPAVKFTGMQPQGLNASSEGEMRAFYDTINAYQPKLFGPNLNFIIDVAQVSLWGARDPDITYEWVPLWELSEKEKSEKRKAEAETAQIDIDSGAIDPAERRQVLVSDPESPYQGLDPDDVPEPPEDPGQADNDEPGFDPEAKKPGDDGRPGAEDAKVLPFGLDAEWSEGDHPRGQPGNVGQFGPGGGGSKTKPESAKGGESRPGFKKTGGGNLAAQGYQPRKKASGTDLTGAMQVAWSHAKQSGNPATLVLTSGPAGGWTILRKGDKVGAGQPHITVGPEGDVARYEGDLGGGSSSESGLASSGSESTSPPLQAKALKRVGEQMGSNPGGVFENAAGERFYVKAGRSKDHVDNEYAAAELGKLAGASLLAYRRVEGGQHIATEMAKLDKDRASQLSPAEVAKAREDFAVHAWLANWDSVGTGGDNLGTIDGVPTALDLGGALSFRAQGEPKGAAFGEQVGEIDTMRNPQMSPDAARVYGKMTDAELKASAAKVTAIPDAKIRRVMEDNGLPLDLANKLIARKRDLAKRFSLQAMDETDAHGHEHAPAGSSTGGQFVSQGGGGGGASSEGEKEKSFDPHNLEGFKIDDPNAEPSKVFKTKKEHAAQLLAEGTTVKDMLTALSWPSISMPQMAKTLGMKLEKIKEGGVTKYKGTPMTAEELAESKTAEKAAKAQKAAAAPAPAPPPAPAPAPPSNLPKPTPAELEKAKKPTTIPAGMFHAGTQNLVAEFNEKYSGKSLTDPDALAAKVKDYKYLKEMSDGLTSASQAEQQKAQQKAQEEAKAKQAEAVKKAAAAATKAAEEAKAKNAAVMKDLGITESEAEGFHALVAMVGGKTADVVEKFKGFELEAKAYGYPITGFQAALIKNYTDGGYGTINSALRSGSWTVAQHVYVKLVNKALQGMPTYEGTVQRGVSLPDAEQAKYQVGHVVEERAFTSTSITNPWSGNTKFTIKAIGKRGAHVKKLSNHKNEDEVVFSARTFFKVTKVETGGGQVHVHMEEMSEEHR